MIVSAEQRKPVSISLSSARRLSAFVSLCLHARSLSLVLVGFARRLSALLASFMRCALYAMLRGQGVQIEE